MASLLVYKMLVLPNVSAEFLTQIESEILGFIWQNKRPKISGRLLKCDKKQGGLRLVDVASRENSLKLTWIYKIFKNDLWSKCFYSILLYNIGPLIWKCNLHWNDIKYIVKEDADEFWKSILVAWCKFNFVDRKQQVDFRNQIIWFNSCIRIVKTTHSSI